MEDFVREGAISAHSVLAPGWITIGSEEDFSANIETIYSIHVKRESTTTHSPFNFSITVLASGTYLAHMQTKAGTAM